MPNNLNVSRRAVLKESVDEDDIFRVTDRNRWKYAGDIEPDPTKGTFYEARWVVSDQGSLHYIVDDFACQAYMIVMHTDKHEAENVIGIIEESLPVWTADEAVKNFDSAGFSPSRAKALMLVGLVTSAHPDNEVLSRVRASAKNPDVRIRRAAVWSMIYSESQNYREDLAEIASTDADRVVADEAQKALDKLIDRKRGE